MATFQDIWTGKSVGLSPIAIQVCHVDSGRITGYLPKNFNNNYVTPELLEQAAQAIREHQAEQERKAQVLVEYQDQSDDKCQAVLAEDSSVKLECVVEDVNIAYAPAGHLDCEVWLTEICKAYHQRMLKRKAQA